MKHNPNSIKLLILSFFFSALGIFSSAAMDEAFIKIEVDGEVIEGFSSILSLGGKDLAEFIELRSFEYELLRDSRGGVAASPFKITKRLDKATPLLAKALANNSRIDAVIYVFDRDPDTGEPLLSTTYTLTQGRLASTRTWRSPASDGVAAQLREEAQITFQSISVLHDPSSTETKIIPGPAQ